MNLQKVKEEAGFKLSTTQENLLTGLAITSKISSRNVNLPILQNVLISARNNILRFSTTNLEIAVSCLVRGKIEGDGEITVPARLFADFVSVLPSGKIDLEIRGNSLVVYSGNSKTKFQGIPASEFPVIPQVTGGRAYKVSETEFRRGAQSVIFAAAHHDAARQDLTGILFRFNESKKGELTLAATDSYRLAEAVLDAEGGDEPAEVIVPSKTASEVTRILALQTDGIDTDGKLKITLAENQVRFDFGNVEIISRTLEGDYPPYKQIIPEKFQTEAVLGRAELAKAAKAASLFSKQGLYDVELSFKEGAPLTVEARDVGTGETHTEVQADIRGKENKAVLNYRYLLDGLGAFLGEEAVLKVVDGANPVLLVPKDKEERYLYIVMPIKQ